MASSIKETIPDQETFRIKATGLCIEGLLYPFGEGTEASQELHDAFHAGELVGIDEVWLKNHLPRIVRRN